MSQIPIKYSKGAIVNIAPFRKQDLVSRLNPLFDIDDISIVVGTKYLESRKAVYFRTTSENCFMLILDCSKFELDREELTFPVIVQYKGKQKLSFEVRLEFLKKQAVFSTSNSFHNITWGKKVECGKIEIMSDETNLYSEWWKYTEKQWLYVEECGCLSVENGVPINKNGKLCYKVPIKARGETTVKVYYNGGSMSIDKEEEIRVSYGLNGLSEIAIFTVSPMAQELNFSLSKRHDTISLLQGVVVFDLSFAKKHNLGPDLKNIEVKIASPLFHVQKCDDYHYEIMYVPNILSYPFGEISSDINISASNCPSCVIPLRLLCASANNKTDIVVGGAGFFAIEEKAYQCFEEEILDGLDIILKNGTQVTFDNVSITSESGAKIGLIHRFEAHSQKRVRILSKLLKWGENVIDVKINGSIYSQRISFTLDKKKKRMPKPKIIFYDVYAENRELSSGDVIFKCAIGNPIQQNEPAYAINPINTDKLSCSPVMVLEPVGGDKEIIAGGGCEFNVRIKDIKQLRETFLFEIYYDGHPISSVNVSLKRDTLTPDPKPEKSLFVPSGKIALARISFTKPTKEGQNDNNEAIEGEVSQISINLPSDLILEIASDGFFFNDGEKTIPFSEGCHDLYLDSSFFWEGLPNITFDEEKECNFRIIKSSNEVLKEFPITYTIHPIETTPIIEATFNGELIYPKNKPSKIPLGVIEYPESWFRKGRRSLVATIVVSNSQSIPYPKIAGKVQIETKCWFENELENWIDVENQNLSLENGESKTVDIFINWEKFGKIKSKVGSNTNDVLVGFSVSIIRPDLQIKDCPETPCAFFGIVLREIRDEEWYALDLGTTGIVIAKKDENSNIVPVEISDNIGEKETPLETDSNIISSITTISKEGDCAKVSLASTREGLNMVAHIIPPAKFVVGQNEIPYSHNYFYPTYDLFGSSQLDELKPKKLILELYRHILSRVDAAGIRRLTLTYPNTYTSDQVSIIKELIIESCPQLKTGFVNAVPESDAALAHYLYLRSRPGAKPRNYKDSAEEKILIYDMGAGTLDISYVVFRFDPKENRGIASVERKIGIPIAGNYLNYSIYHSLKDKLGKNQQWEGKGKIRTLEKLKVDLCGMQDKELPYNFKDEDNKMKGRDVLESEEVSTYLSFCSKRVFEVLFGTSDWTKEIDCFVFSGRASKFEPLREKIYEQFGDQAENIIDTETISDGELKKSVAMGAIEYTDSYSSEKDTNPYRIVSINQYYNIYVVYETYGERGNIIIGCEELVNPFETDWENVPVINGTKTKSLSGDVSITVHPSSKKIIIIQSLLSRDDIAKLYQKLWYPSPGETRHIIEDDCFVNEVLCIPKRELGGNLKEVKISIDIDENNNLKLLINNSEYTGERIREDIESNPYYNANYLLSND